MIKNNSLKLGTWNNTILVQLPRVPYSSSEFEENVALYHCIQFIRIQYRPIISIYITVKSHVDG